MVLRREGSAGWGRDNTDAGSLLLAYVLRVLLALLLSAAVIAIVARANEVMGTSGEAAGAASGYVVSEIKYSLLASDPTRVDGITFNVTDGEGRGVPGQVTVTVNDGAHWTTCLYAGGLRWSCPVRTAVRELTSLRVVAAQ
jgi:hypothetical protein